MVFRSDHFSVLFRLAPSTRQVTAFSFAASAFEEGAIRCCIKQRALAAAPPPAIVERAAHRAASTLPVASVILKFEGKVTFAL